MSKVAVIIVCYNNQEMVKKAAASLQEQSLLPAQVLIADSGSSDLSYLSLYQKPPFFAFSSGKEVGFCVANNVAYHQIDPNIEYVLFQNPDCFLTPGFIEEAVRWMQSHPQAGCISGTLKGYDFAKQAPTGKLDSTGIFRTWYGRWYDRGQGKNETFYYSLKSDQPNALCGALLFCRKRVLEKVMLRNGDIFDSSFFMYKEDIDLSLRIKEGGYTLHYVPELVAYHCRGWNCRRSKILKKFRLCSAQNEQTIHRKQQFVIPYLYSSVKWALVKYGNW